MNIVIAGYGYVGKAVESFIKEHHNVTIVDPAFNKNTISNSNPTAVIICVSTPESADGSCDVSNVIQVINETPKEVPILIKSTISLEGWKEIRKSIAPLRITFSPEFLRAKTAIDDFQNQKVMYFSNGNVFWKELFSNINPKLQFKEFTAEELVLAKYFRNSFLATKVTFFNQVFDLCKKIRTVDYEAIRQIVTDDNRIGEGHSKITDERGFGGHCFPKDTKAIVDTASKNNSDLSLIKTAIDYNKQVQKNNKVNLDLRTLQKESARALVVMQNADNLSLSEINQKVNHDSTLFYKKVLEKYIELFGDLPSNTKEGKEVNLIME
tara:strand:+ start:795 stop:1766 length:972 start_codon:yes stop_codon:yes gene_type:complete